MLHATQHATQHATWFTATRFTCSRKPWMIIGIGISKEESRNVIYIMNCGKHFNYTNTLLTIKTRLYNPYE